MDSQLSKLFDAIGEPEAWRQAIDEYADTFNAEICVAALIDDVSSLLSSVQDTLARGDEELIRPALHEDEAPSLLAVGLPRATLASYMTRHAQHDHLMAPFHQSMTQYRCGTVCDSGYFAAGHHLDSVFFHDYIQPNRLADRMIGWSDNPINPRYKLLISLSGRSLNTPFTPREVRRLRADLPDLQRMAYLHSQTVMLKNRVRGMERMMDTLPVAMLFVNAQGQLQHANLKARRLLGERRCPELQSFLRGGVNQSNTPDTIRALFLRALVGHSTCQTVTSRAANATEDELTVLALGIRELGDLGLHMDSAGVAFLLIERQPLACGAVTMARDAYGLSLAEARLLQHLVQGGTPQEFAALRQVKISTVRSQLSTLLYKTRSERQQDLIALVTRLLLVAPATDPALAQSRPSL